MITVRAEQKSDREAVHRINRLAFGQPLEADLVDSIRDGGNAIISLIAADEDGAVLGHILFSPVTLLPAIPGVRGLGLGPMAVHPDRQRQGIGSMIVRAGLDRARTMGYDFLVLLGHPGYYPRFGFRVAEEAGIRCPYDAPPEAFMVLELTPGCLAGYRGTVRYLPQFDAA
jgi:putative acetyltransferase